MNRRRVKVWKDDRIVYYDKYATSEFWDNTWKNSTNIEFFKRYETGCLDEFHDIFIKYLDKSNRILEAGCGNGKYVLALRRRGFEHIEGLDWASKTVEQISAIFPDLQIKYGDVTRIDVNDNFYDNYISLGVVEHRYEGPDPFLKEAWRVLKSKGIAIFTVPYVNPLRKLKAKIGFYNPKNLVNGEFYQYAFSINEFISYLHKHGFKIIETKPISGYYGLKEELPIFFSILKKVPGGWRLRNAIQNSTYLDVFGHVCVFVCTKP